MMPDLMTKVVMSPSELGTSIEKVIAATFRVWVIFLFLITRPKPMLLRAIIVIKR